MEEYKNKKSKLMNYTCTVCKKKCKNEEELRQHVSQTKHYYKTGNILVEDEEEKKYHISFKELYI